MTDPQKQELVAALRILQEENPEGVARELGLSVPAVNRAADEIIRPDWLKPRFKSMAADFGFGMAVQGLSVPESVLGVAMSRKGSLMLPAIPKSRSRKVNSHVKRVLALEAIRKRRAERYERYVRPLDVRCNALMADAGTRALTLSGGQAAKARRILHEIRSRSVS
jgi:hypothetical protein